MFVRRTQTRRTDAGKPYFSHRLVHAERIGNTVRQRTLLNLGRHFDIPNTEWPRLCARVEDILNGQAPVLPDCPPDVEEEAQRIAAQLVARGAGGPSNHPADVQPVDVSSLRLVRPRSVGVEQIGLWALEKLGLPALLADLGINGALRAAATGAIIGRLAQPASERATHRWLQQRSGLGELLGTDFETTSAMQLYRASDALVKHRQAIEERLFDRAMGLFDLQPTVTLYDLTNTYFEGEAGQQPQAQRGHSKEKRTDCPLLTLGLVLDASGFVRRSQVFAGNVREQQTLAGMLGALQAPQDALVVMDRGVATEACVTWLRDNGYRYLVVSRERHRQFDTETAVSVRTRSEQTVHLHKTVSTDPDEVRLYCFSEERANKERAIVERFTTRFEAALAKLNDGLARPRAHKRLDQVWQRIGRLKSRHTRVAAHYQIDVTADETGERAAAVTWTRRPKDGSMLTHPGIYCLRSSETDWDEETLWRTYTTLTDVEAVFRSLKSELGLRPIYHHKPRRAEGHLFITVVAYQLAQVIRTRLRTHGEHASWSTLRRILEGQQRVTATFRRPDGRTLHVRTATQPEPEQRAIYDALGVDSHPGGVRKTII
jgi:transposase